MKVSIFTPEYFVILIMEGVKCVYNMIPCNGKIIGNFRMLTASNRNEAKHFFCINTIPEVYSIYNRGLLEMHVCNFYVIGWGIKMDGQYIVENDSFELKSNSLIFLAPGDVHMFERLSKAEGYFIVFSEDYLSHFGITFFQKIKYELFKCVPPLFLTCEETKRELSKFVENLFQEFSILEEDSFIHEMRIVSFLTLFLTSVLNSSEYKLLHIRKILADIPRNALYLRFLEVLEIHYKENHLVKDYLRKLNISQRTLMLCTSDNAKSSPLDIINLRIILEAKKLLCFTKLTVTEISLYLGFKDTSYFAKLFKRYEKMSPTDYRESILILNKKEDVCK